MQQCPGVLDLCQQSYAGILLGSAIADWDLLQRTGKSGTTLVPTPTERALDLPTYRLRVSQLSYLLNGTGGEK